MRGGAEAAGVGRPRAPLPGCTRCDSHSTIHEQRKLRGGARSHPQSGGPQRRWTCAAGGTPRAACPCAAGWGDIHGGWAGVGARPAAEGKQPGIAHGVATSGRASHPCRRKQATTPGKGRTRSVASDRSLPICLVSPLTLRPRMSNRFLLDSRSKGFGADGASPPPRPPRPGPRPAGGALRFFPLPIGFSVRCSVFWAELCGAVEGGQVALVLLHWRGRQRASRHQQAAAAGGGVAACMAAIAAAGGQCGCMPHATECARL